MLENYVIKCFIYLGVTSKEQSHNLDTQTKFFKRYSLYLCQKAMSRKIQFLNKESIGQKLSRISKEVANHVKTRSITGLKQVLPTRYLVLCDHVFVAMIREQVKTNPGCNSPSTAATLTRICAGNPGLLEAFHPFTGIISGSE